MTGGVGANFDTRYNSFGFVGKLKPHLAIAVFANLDMVYKLDEDVP